MESKQRLWNPIFHSPMEVGDLCDRDKGVEGYTSMKKLRIASIAWFWNRWIFGCMAGCRTQAGTGISRSSETANDYQSISTQCSRLPSADNHNDLEDTREGNLGYFMLVART